MRRNMYTPLKKNKNEDDSFNMGDKLEPDSIKNLI